MRTLRNRSLAAGAALALVSFVPAVAHAGEGLFSRVYTTDLTPAGHFELEQLVRLRDGRAYGSYDALDYRSEFEYGVTDNFQAAFYVNTNQQNARGAPDDDDPNGDTGFSRHNFTLQSLSTEFIYRLVSPYKNKHHWGIALYIEPEYMFHDLHNGLTYAPGTFEIESRLIVQKNFLDDKLIATYNLVIEGESLRFSGRPDRHSELDFNNEAGITYRFFPNIFFGFEARNHNEYGDFKQLDHSVFWVGPVAHYGGRRAWATLGWLRQVHGVPGTDETGRSIGGDLFLRSHELNEVTFKIGFPF